MRRLTSLKSLLSIDWRALAAWRVALGVLLVVDTLSRWTDLIAFYSDDGVLPLKPYLERWANPLHFSLHDLSGDPAWQTLLFALAVAAGVCIAVGYRTRLATLTGWILLVSVQNRNPLLLNGGDVLLRVLFFWGLFLPLGAVASVDAARARDRGPGRSSAACFGGATVALILQIAMVYLTAAVLKSGREWWPDGTASYYALSLDSFTTSLGVWMKQWWELLRVSTWIVYWLEAMTAVLIFCPVYTTAVRLLLIAALAVMHLSFAAAMRLGIFPWVDLAALIPLVPGEAIDWLAKRLGRAPSPAASSAPREPLVVTFVTLFLIGAVAVGNDSTIPDSSLTLAQPVLTLTTALRLDQRWNMFAPYPLKEGGWFVMPGVLANGSKVDLIAGDGHAPTDAEPALASDLFPSARWRKYMMTIYDRSKADYRLYFGKYVCRTWNGTHDDHDGLEHFELAFMRRPTVLPGEPAPIERVVLWQHDCHPPSPVASGAATGTR